ncbi:MAG TPA: hypothetical protein ENJ17_01785 [Gammaproteobacteria bacterium]|nr:hypothetical protein [Gammaproteobacteria bacterium]
MATGSLIPETPSALLQPAPDTQTTGQPVEHPIGPQTIPPRREEAQAATAPLHPQEPEPRPENEAPHSPIAGNSATLRTQRILDALAPHATPQPPDTGPAASMTMPSTPPGHRPSRGEPTGEIPSSDQTPTRGKTDRRVMPAPVSRETSAGITDHLDANLRPAQDPALGLPLPESGNATLLAPAWLAELSKLQSSLQTHGPEPTTPPREEPVVNVTIGRIEIKASPEPPASAPRKENKPRGVMTLQDYLQQRNEARS